MDDFFKNIPLCGGGGVGGGGCAGGGAIGVKWRNELSVREPYTKDQRHGRNLQVVVECVCSSTRHHTVDLGSINLFTNFHEKISVEMLAYTDKFFLDDSYQLVTRLSVCASHSGPMIYKFVHKFLLRCLHRGHSIATCTGRGGGVQGNIFM